MASDLQKLLIVVVLSLYCSNAEALKILIFSPGVSGSHVMFNYRLASILAKHGHETVVYTKVLLQSAVEGLKSPSNVREIRLELSYLDNAIVQGAVVQRQRIQDKIWQDSYWARILGSFMSMIQFGYFKELIGASCKAALGNETVLAQLRIENFDIALTHYMFLCPLAIGRAVGIEKFILVTPGNVIFDRVASLLGIPLLRSYVPNALSNFTDRMTFMERTENLILESVFVAHSKLRVNHAPLEEQIFQDYCAKNGSSNATTSLRKVAIEQVQTLFMNGEGTLEYPRPYLPGMVFLGQMDASDHVDELDETRKALVSSGKDGVILFSLGTIAGTSDMPFEMKAAFFEAFKRFPTYTIICRIEGDLPADLQGHPHIKTVQWLPQRSLLYHGRVKLFITHGGYNSLVETASAGVPMLLLPLYGDQYGNVKRAVRHGLGLELDKRQIDADVIVQKMNAILSDPSYKESAEKFARRMRDKIIANENVIARQVVSIAKSRRRLVSRARNLSWIRLYSLDVILTVLMVATTVILGS